MNDHGFERPVEVGETTLTTGGRTPLHRVPVAFPFFAPLNFASAPGAPFQIGRRCGRTGHGRAG